MNHNALIQAATAVGRAEKALAKLEDAASIADATEAWIDFLSSFSRLYTKLDAGSKSDDQSVAWFAGIKRLRKDDQLLCYLHHARNSDYHRLEDVTQHEKGGITIGAKGALHLRQLGIVNDQVYADWSPAAPGEQLVVTLLSSGLVAVPVTDRGKTYAVPTSHLGQPLPDGNVLTLGRAAMTYAETLLQEAGQRVT
jgi:hypothetical protein